MEFEYLATPRESDVPCPLPYMVLEEPPKHANVCESIQANATTMWTDLRRRFQWNSGENRHKTKPFPLNEWRRHSHEYVTASVRYYASNLSTLQKELLCGIAVALLHVPETVAFSYVAGVDPLVGLYATAFLGIIVGAFGGTDGIVAGAAGALAVVMPQLTSGTGTLGDRPYEERLQHLFMAVFFTGVIQLAFGILGITRYLSMIPNTAMIGFLNGLSIVMFYTQFSTFQVCKNPADAFHTCMRDGTLEWMSVRDASTWTTAAIVILTMLIMHYFPKVPKIGSIIPSTLVVAGIGVALEFGVHRPLLHAPTRTIGEITPLSGGSFPLPRWPSVGNSPNWSAILSTSASLAVVGVFESILTLQVVCELTKRKVTTASCRQETLAQGVGNVVCGLLGCMGGCSMIGQSTGNIINGARGRLSAVIGGFTTLAIVLGAGPVVEQVPVACLTGIMFVIVLHTFYWPTFRLLLRLQVADCIGIILVSALAAAINLAVAVVAGIVWHALVHAWEHSHLLSHRVDIEPNGVKVYSFQGTFLFSSAQAFRLCFDVANDPKQVAVDFDQCLVVDFSAVAAVRQVALRYRDAGKQLIIRNLNEHSLKEFNSDMQWQQVPEWPLAEDDHEE